MNPHDWREVSPGLLSLLFDSIKHSVALEDVPRYTSVRKKIADGEPLLEALWLLRIADAAIRSGALKEILDSVADVPGNTLRDGVLAWAAAALSDLPPETAAPVIARSTGLQAVVQGWQQAESERLAAADNELRSAIDSIADPTTRQTLRSRVLQSPEARSVVLGAIRMDQKASGYPVPSKALLHLGELSEAEWQTVVRVLSQRQ